MGIRGIGGPTPRGSIYQGGGAKNWKNGVFAASKAPRNIFEYFFRNVSTNKTPKITFSAFFGKFVNKNAIKSDFWGVVGRYISKISKKSQFLAKRIHLPTSKFF